VGKRGYTTPTYLSGAFAFAMGEQSDLALLLLAILLIALIGTGISRRWPIAGGAMLILLGILGVFVIFVTRPTFVWWSLPQLANIPIVGLLPVASGIYILFSWREQFYIDRNHKESSRRLSQAEELVDWDRIRRKDRGRRAQNQSNKTILY